MNNEQHPARRQKRGDRPSAEDVAALSFGDDEQTYAQMYNHALDEAKKAGFLSVGDAIRAAAAPALQVIDAPRVEDGFRGDNDQLCSSIEALLELDAANALVPHGVGGHARGLLAAAASRLRALPIARQAQPTDRDAWISADERLPDGECLAVYVTPNGKQHRIRAKYVRQFQIEAEGDDCKTEYNDDDDTFYIKAGWLECIDNWGEYSSCYVVEGTVTHWTAMPALPALKSEQKG